MGHITPALPFSIALFSIAYQSIRCNFHHSGLDLGRVGDFLVFGGNAF
jgi:hypothetical protein